MSHGIRSQQPQAPTRSSKQTRDLFAPVHLRRPTSRTTPRVEDEVLADPDSEQELVVQRRVRKGSPVGRQTRLLRHQRYEEELEIVNRRADGGYLLGMTGEMNEIVKGFEDVPEVVEEREMREQEAEHAETARAYFVSGGKKQDEDYQQVAAGMMVHLRHQAMQCIEDERWMFEPTDRSQSRLP